MQDREKWLELCERASKEQDRKKPMALIKEIDRLLEEKRERISSRIQKRGSGAV